MAARGAEVDERSPSRIARGECPTGDEPGPRGRGVAPASWGASMRNCSSRIRWAKKSPKSRGPPSRRISPLARPTARRIARGGIAWPRPGCPNLDRPWHALRPKPSRASGGRHDHRRDFARGEEAPLEIQLPAGVLTITLRGGSVRPRRRPSWRNSAARFGKISSAVQTAPRSTRNVPAPHHDHVGERSDETHDQAIMRVTAADVTSALVACDPERDDPVDRGHGIADDVRTCRRLGEAQATVHARELGRQGERRAPPRSGERLEGREGDHRPRPPRSGRRGLLRTPAPWPAPPAGSRDPGTRSPRPAARGSPDTGRSRRAAPGSRRSRSRPTVRRARRS